MSIESDSSATFKLFRVTGVAAAAVVLNIVFHHLRRPSTNKTTQLEEIQEDLILKKSRSQRQRTSIVEKTHKWGKLEVQDLIPADNALLQELRLMSALMAEFEKVPNLIVDLRLKSVVTYKNPIIQNGIKYKKQEPSLSPESLVQPGAFVINSSIIQTAQMLYFQKKWLRAGPRSHIYFNPTSVVAAIVTCGSLCPGTNILIKQLVEYLKNTYRVPKVYGIKFSFKGFCDYDWEDLTPESVKTIHHSGGSYLGISRTKVDVSSIVDCLFERGVNQLYVVGGIGTLFTVGDIYANIKSKGLNIAICTLAKSITNQISIIDKAFGFETALQETQRAIEAAYVESHSHSNGISIVKVEGKVSGFLAMEACLASSNVNVCLVPEFEFDLGGDKGLLNYVKYRIQNKKNTLIVVSEGCSQSVRDYHIKTIDYEWDGTPIKEDIGIVLKREIQGFLEPHGIKANVKYIDPTDMIRAMPSNPYDSKLCSDLAHSSIHGLMCGYTGFVSGYVTNTDVMIPMQEILSGNYENRIMKYSPNWQRLLASTGQPSLLNETAKMLVKDR